MIQTKAEYMIEVWQKLDAYQQMAGVSDWGDSRDHHLFQSAMIDLRDGNIERVREQMEEERNARVVAMQKGVAA